MYQMSGILVPTLFVPHPGAGYPGTEVAPVHVCGLPGVHELTTDEETGRTIAPHGLSFAGCPKHRKERNKVIRQKFAYFI